MKHWANIYNVIRKWNIYTTGLRSDHAYTHTLERESQRIQVRAFRKSRQGRSTGSRIRLEDLGKAFFGKLSFQKI